MLHDNEDCVLQQTVPLFHGPVGEGGDQELLRRQLLSLVIGLDVTEATFSKTHYSLKEAGNSPS